MCVRYVRVDPRSEKIQRKLNVLIGDSSVDEVFPGYEGRIILTDRNIVPATWGMQPSWADKPNWGRQNAYNARSETMWEKPTFQNAIKKQRCLVAASAFYERAAGSWLKVSPEDDEPILIASLFEPPNHWTQGLPTYTLVTTVPNLRIADLHDRMPVVLTPDDAVAWLDPNTPRDDLRALMVPCPDERLRIEDAGPISRKKEEEPPPTLF